MVAIAAMAGQPAQFLQVGYRIVQTCYRRGTDLVDPGSRYSSVSVTFTTGRLFRGNFKAVVPKESIFHLSETRIMTKTIWILQCMEAVPVFEGTLLVIKIEQPDSEIGSKNQHPTNFLPGLGSMSWHVKI